MVTMTDAQLDRASKITPIGMMKALAKILRESEDRIGERFAAVEKRLGEVEAKQALLDSLRRDLEAASRDMRERIEKLFAGIDPDDPDGDDGEPLPAPPRIAA